MLASPDSQPTLRVVGAMHVDEVATVQGRLVPEASNSVVWQRFLGGVGSNAARAAQAVYNSQVAGNTVNFHTALGDDNTAQTLVNRMQGEGIQVESQLIKAHSTGRYSVVVDESGQLVLGLADVQLAEHLDAAPIMPTILSELTSALVLDANLSPACIKSLVEIASSTSVMVAALTVSPSKAVRLLPWAEQIGLLFCNRREALALGIESKLIPAFTAADHLSLQQLGNVLVELGFNDFVLTDAASELLVRCQGILTRVPVPFIKVEHNVNGAGDALAGASIAALSSGLPLVQAVAQIGLSLAADVLSGKRLPLGLGTE